MIKLDYLLPADELSKVEARDLRQVTAAELDYYLFRGNIYFTVDGNNFDADWGWVPIIEFASQLFLLTKRLPKTFAETFEFTESGETIGLSLAQEIVTISPSYVTASATAVYPELQTETTMFVQRVLQEFSDAFPALLENPEFLERSRITGLRDGS